jgi:hypothetical protein
LMVDPQTLQRYPGLSSGKGTQLAGITAEDRCFV